MAFVLGMNKKELETYNVSNQRQSQSDLAARLAAIDTNDLNAEALAHLLGDIDIHNLTDADAVLLDDLLGFEAQSTRHGNINKEVRMVLLGETGNGKSSFGNTIIGNDKFKVKFSSKSVTRECQKEEREYKGKKLLVVDSPGFFDTSLPSEEIEDEIAKSYQILAPGPHAFLIVHNIRNRFTNQQRTAAKLVRVVFGEQAVHFCIIVFTGIDELEKRGSNIEEYLGDLEPDDPLKDLLNDYGGRYIAVNNEGTNAHKEDVLDELLVQMQEMVFKTADGFYSTSKFKEVADVVGKSKAQGHVMVNPDGSIVLIPEVKKIMGSYLRGNLGRNSLTN